MGKPHKIYKSFVYRTIKRYEDTGSIKKRHKGGQSLTATSPANIKTVRERLRREPRRSGRKLAKELKISQDSVRRIIKNKLHKTTYKIQKIHQLTDAQKKVRAERVKRLLARHAKHEIPNIVFSDEKIFTVEQVVNKQNDRIYLDSSEKHHLNEYSATRTQKPASVMVWAGVTSSGWTPLVFVPAGVKINQAEYQNRVLEHCLLPWSKKHFKKKPLDISTRLCTST